MKTKVVGRLITIILLLIIILGGVFAYLYFGTDLLKSNGQLFLKYLGQAFYVQDGFVDSQLTEYSKKKYNGKYEDSGTFSTEIDISGIDEETLQTINDFNITYSGKIDNTTRKNEQNITLNYSDDVNFPFNYKYANETLGLQSDYVSSKYIGIENNNLKEFVEKFGVTDTTEIPDTIDLFSAFTNQETINFTDEEREQLTNTYSSILQEKLGGKEFTKTKENDVTSYSVSITNQEIKDLIRTILETVKNDSILMPKMEQMFKDILDTMNQTSDNEVTVQSMIQEIIDDMNNVDSNSDEGTNTITVSQTNKKLSAITLTVNDTSTNVELKITKTNDSGNLTYGMEMNATDIETQENVRYFYTAGYQGLEELASVNENYQFGIIRTMDGEEQKMIYNLNCTDTFNDGLTIEDYAEDEIQLLNDYDAEQITTLMMTIVERINEVNTMQMEKIGFSEYGNPILYTFPLTSIGLLTYNQAADVVNESSMSEVEMNAFNAKFEQYEGVQSGSTVRALLQSVIANNISEMNGDRKVEVSGVVTMSKDDTSVPTDEINTGSTYNVELQYTEGLVSGIIITEQ